MNRGWLLLIVLCGCGDGSDAPRDAAADAPSDTPTCPATTAPTVTPTGAAVCNPLMQTDCASGEKCTWRSDVQMIGCVPNGSIPAGCACSTGAGYDDCVAGAYCESGTCKVVCDPQGGIPMCAVGYHCVPHRGVFMPAAAPTVAGVCERACDPLADNDFDGPGTLFSKGSGCDATRGCYGFPSGTPPGTSFTCQALGDAALIHRSPAPTLTFINSCAQGYLPLLFESYAVRTIICTALCQPQNCYAGNCGANNDNRLGVVPHRCTTTDRLGTFNTSPGGEHCLYLWSLEIDRQTGMLLRSQYSDTVGVCFDHSTFVYDSDGDGQLTSSDLPLPACGDLQLVGTHLTSDLGNPTVFWGASDAQLGCVDTAQAGIPAVPRVRAQLDFVPPAYGPMVAR